MLFHTISLWDLLPHGDACTKRLARLRGRKGYLGIYMGNRFSKEKGSSSHQDCEVQSRSFSFSLSDVGRLWIAARS